MVVNLNRFGKKIRCCWANYSWRCCKKIKDLLQTVWPQLTFMLNESRFHLPTIFFDVVIFLFHKTIQEILWLKWNFFCNLETYSGGNSYKIMQKFQKIYQFWNIHFLYSNWSLLQTNWRNRRIFTLMHLHIIF